MPNPETTKPRMAIEIDGRKVTLEMMFPDHYAAIKYYEEIVSNCHRDGNFTLKMEVNPHA